MHVQLVLDSPHSVFTNLDWIRGRVILRLTGSTPLTGIIVKLEGECRTLLISQGRPEIRERPRPVEETHKLAFAAPHVDNLKVLYKLATVFPGPNLPPLTSHVTLGAGHYEYPFEFKIPFNSSCDTSARSQTFNLGALRLEAQRAPVQHVRATLPPTLTSFPGLAEIKYFLKVTVNRKEFYKENPRVIRIFNFLPIEPPRPARSNEEIYIRRRHHYLPMTAAGQSKDKLKRAFSNISKTSFSSDILPEISVEARLPSPPIITCNEALPLRILVKRFNNSKELLYLQMLQIELIGKTLIRAQEVVRGETSSWIVASVSNVASLIQFPSPPQDEEQQTKSQDADRDKSTAIERVATIDSSIWRMPLPNSVAPSFEACNIGRKYELGIRIGIGYGPQFQRNQVVLPLHLPVTVYSGIHPPAELLNAMSQRPAAEVDKGKKPVTKKPLSPEAQSNVSAAQAASSSQSSPTSPNPATTPIPAGEEEPPPSYEDAIAQEMPPVDGPRHYQPPPLPQGGAEFRMNEKGRRNS